MPLSDCDIETHVSFFEALTPSFFAMESQVSLDCTT
jgi:hypothetical protein